MKTGSQRWQRLIRDGATALGVSVSADQTARFARHARLLETWNQKINLTAISDPAQIAVRHFVDALAPVPLIAPEALLLDVGSGAGFPGIPLKIACPSLRVRLVDASRKKVNFQRFVIRTLGLSNIGADHMRIEEMARRERYRMRFDVIVSRAVTDVDALVALAAPLLKDTGCIIGMCGRKTAGGATPGGGFVTTVTDYALAGMVSERSLVVTRRSI